MINMNLKKKKKKKKKKLTVTDNIFILMNIITYMYL